MKIEAALAPALFAGYIHDLAAALIGLEQKCALCAYSDACGGKTLLPPCSVGIEKFLMNRSSAFLTELAACYKAYFAYLDRLAAKGGYDLCSAEEALKVEFPYLSGRPECAKLAIALWLLTHDALRETL